MSLHVLERKWLRLWNGTPGHRFQNLYRRAHRNGEGEELTTHFVRFGLALVFLCVGIILFFLPLVYIPFLLGSAALFASESRLFARWLDHAEAWVRRTGQRWKERLGLSAAQVNVIAAIASIGGIAIMGFACYKTFSH
jgi:uncharacterized membrane protein YbaN (DUF454 family)